MTATLPLLLSHGLQWKWTKLYQSRPNANVLVDTVNNQGQLSIFPSYRGILASGETFPVNVALGKDDEVALLSGSGQVRLDHFNQDILVECITVPPSFINECRAIREKAGWNASHTGEMFKRMWSAVSQSDIVTHCLSFKVSMKSVKFTLSDPKRTDRDAKEAQVGKEQAPSNMMASLVIHSDSRGAASSGSGCGASVSQCVGDENKVKVES